MSSSEQVYVKIMFGKKTTANELIILNTGSIIRCSGSNLTIDTGDGKTITRTLDGPVYVMNNQGVTINTYTPE